MAINWTGIGEGFIGGTINQIGSGITSSLFGPSVKKQLRWQKEAQKELNLQAAQLNYHYGKLAAQDAFNKQMQMYERSYNDQSYKAMRGQMEDAGLSVGLMYGGSGSGGGQGSMTGAPQGATGGAVAGDAASGLSAALAMKQLQLQQASVYAQNAKAYAEAEEIKTRKDKNVAETSQIEIATQQAQESFEWTLKDMEETAKGKWLENAAKRFNMEVEDLAGKKEISDEKFGKLTIKAGALFNNEAVNNAIKRALEKEDIDGANMLRQAQAAFEDEKVKHYATQVFTAVRMADIADKEATTRRLEYALHAIDTEVRANMAQAEIAKIAQELILNPDKVGAEIDKMIAEKERNEFESGGWAKAKVIFTCIAALSGAYAGFVGTNAKVASAVAGK